jgi:hypothetical protein
MKLAIPILGALAVASGAFAATGYTHAPSGGLEKRFTSTKPYVTTSGSTCTVTVCHSHCLTCPDHQNR